MVYLNENMTPEQARATYKTLMRTIHPDCGGNIIEAQALNAEYEEIKAFFARGAKRRSTQELTQEINCIEKILAECHHAYNYFICGSGRYVEVTLGKGTQPQHIIAIERRVREYTASHGLTLGLHYKHQRKKAHTITTQRQITFIDFDPDDYQELNKQKPYTDSIETLLWRICAVHNGRKYAYFWDKVRGHGYLMRRSQTLSLTDLGII